MHFCTCCSQNNGRADWLTTQDAFCARMNPPCFAALIFFAHGHGLLMEHETNTFMSQYLPRKQIKRTARGSPRAFHGGRTGWPKAKGHDMEAKETNADSQELTSGVPRRAHGLAKGKRT